ncbi:MAG TPA: hypothetical protein PKH79_07775 [Prolixibacteraceae bacterium]|nr:hypothetical protein [Prolixibacteraceae bacterium]
MASKLSNYIPQYHTFENNQVLTEYQLNEVINYLDIQNRYSRLYLCGVGIACGFEISYNSALKIITITQGTGITTDGDLIKLQSIDAGKSKLPFYASDKIDYTHFKPFNDKTASYPPFKRKDTLDRNPDGIPIDLIEIVPEGVDNSKPLSALPDIENKVAMLYLECYANPRNICTAVDCDNQGIEQVAKLRVLLVSKDDAEYIKSTDTIYTKHSIQTAYLQLSEIAVPRVLLNSTNGTSQSNVQKSFYSAIKSNSILYLLRNSISILFNNFGKLLHIETGITADKINLLIDQLFGFSATAIPSDVQYRYDLLKDLTDTYNEIKGVLLRLNTEFNPDIKSFPKHLMLGKVVASEGSDPLRHSFYPSAATAYNQNMAKFSSLVTRFYLMLAQYQIAGSEIKITPSKQMVPLSSRSIPCYFKVDEKLIENWDFSKTTRYMQKENLCYFTENLSSASHIQTPLKFNLDAYDFFRIEGATGLSASNAEVEINSLRTSFGLDFEFRIFDLEKDQRVLQTFICKNNSLEHLAGVAKGGTFILLKKSDTIVADYALKYRIQAETSSDFCCKISECSYPWFSSLKYLNNLSRSLKGTQSNKKLMPKSYRLLISHYSINSINLIDQPVEITIPLSELFLRRIHVVAEKLNNKFPTGVVFDFDQKEKQLKIKRIQDDTFQFTVKDITLSTSSPTYTYTENNYLRNSKQLQAKVISCSEVKIHHKSIYQQLHSQYNPVNKDDDYGLYDGQWEKWDKLINKLITNPFFTEKKIKRLISNQNDLPSAIKEEIRQIKADVIKANSSAKMYLSGEWVNGTWVDGDMLEYYNAHRKNTHDNIVLFINLRNKLHQRTGKSKLCIFIPAGTNDQLKTLQTKYNKIADFYSVKAEGGNYIEIG